MTLLLPEKKRVEVSRDSTSRRNFQVASLVCARHNIFGPKLTAGKSVQKTYAVCEKTSPNIFLCSVDYHVCSIAYVLIKEYGGGTSINSMFFWILTEHINNNEQRLESAMRSLPMHRAVIRAVFQKLLQPGIIYFTRVRRKPDRNQAACKI